jgi:hypothetical protein
MGRGDEAFEPALRRLVARPDRFVGLQQQAARHMSIELAGDVSRVVDEKIMAGKQPTEDLYGLTQAKSFSSPEQTLLRRWSRKVL